VSSATAKPDQRTRLVNAAIDLLATAGPEALQARKVAAGIGASTMAVYTHFGDMAALIDAVAREGFTRLAASLGAVPHTDDPVADLFRLGLAYRRTALDNPNLYALTFGLSAPGGRRAATADMTGGRTSTELPEGHDAFTHLVDCAARAMTAGRFRIADATLAAAQLWSALHGFVALEIAGFYGGDDHAVGEVLLPMAVSLAIGMGDAPTGAQYSALAAALPY
jgi:AcrR family transcriptional regulator